MSAGNYCQSECANLRTNPKAAKQKKSKKVSKLEKVGLWWGVGNNVSAGCQVMAHERVTFLWASLQPLDTTDLFAAKGKRCAFVSRTVIGCPNIPSAATTLLRHSPRTILTWNWDWQVLEIPFSVSPMLR